MKNSHNLFSPNMPTNKFRFFQNDVGDLLKQGEQPNKKPKKDIFADCLPDSPLNRMLRDDSPSNKHKNLLKDPE
jgi:hypothetical protein